jgi:short-subunit dehydrogenase
MPPSIVIVGAGPNLGAAVARRFGREGLAVGLVARNEEKLAALAADPRDVGGGRPRAAAVQRARSGRSVTTVVGQMVQRGSGTILFTTGGAAVIPYPARAGVGISFAAEVAYARMLHAELADRGIHVGHTAIAGRIAPGGDHEPADIADVLWDHHADRAAFQVRIGID